METIVMVSNLLPTKANPENISPHERFATVMGMPEEARKPYIRHLRTYFCHAYYYIKPQKRDKSDKFGPRAEKGRLIGYADLHGKIYWVWNPKTSEIVRASAVKFNEGEDYRPDDDCEGPEYEAVFADTTIEEDESVVEFWRTTALNREKKQVHFQLPSREDDGTDNDTLAGQRTQHARAAKQSQQRVSAPQRPPLREERQQTTGIGLPTPNVT
jgi:hypothetical protein